MLVYLVASRRCTLARSSNSRSKLRSLRFTLSDVEADANLEQDVNIFANLAMFCFFFVRTSRPNWWNGFHSNLDTSTRFRHGSECVREHGFRTFEDIRMFDMVQFHLTNVDVSKHAPYSVQRKFPGLIITRKNKKSLIFRLFGWIYSEAKDF